MNKKISKIVSLVGIPAMLTPTLLVTSCQTCQHEASEELVSLYAGNRKGAMYKCKRCGQPVYVDKNPTPTELGMPTFNLVGDFTGMTKDTKKTMLCYYKDTDESKDFDCVCTAKWQGNSSLAYPKKNFNIQFFEDVKLKTEKEMTLLRDGINTNKYTFKAYYRDPSTTRNILLSNLIKDIYDKDDNEDCYKYVPYHGQVDGYPVAFYCNDIYWGTYTISTKKDKDMFSKKPYKATAILVANDYTNSTALYEPISTDLSNGWEFEYVKKMEKPEGGEETEEEAQQRVIGEFNEFIKKINDATIEEFPTLIDSCSSKARLIDCLICLDAFALGDNVSKNMIWATYDDAGEKWYPFIYDLDQTIGLNFYEIPEFPDVKFDGFKYNALFDKFWKSFSSDIKTKYQEFRQAGNALSNDVISNAVDTYFNKSSAIAYKSNKERWPDAPYSGAESTLEFIKQWLITRLNWLDNHFDEN